MAELRFCPDFSSAFGRQYNKLSEQDKTPADGAIRDLVSLANLGEPNSEQGRQLARSRRVKVIQRVKRTRPQRMEASFAPHCRIVWTLGKPYIRFLYIGNHPVLDKR